MRIGDRVEKGLHLLQVWMIRPMGGEEVLVLYPQDGYWRLRPLAPAGMAPTAFGSSFLIGPVEVEGRPIVKIKEVAFDPKTRTFTLDFERGGSATVKMASADQNRHALDVAFDKADRRAGRSRRCARCTSPSSTTTSPASPCARRAPRAGAKTPIMAFERATATDIWAGRIAPSRHNTSSPDMVFNGFSDGQGSAASQPRYQCHQATMTSLPTAGGAGGANRRASCAGSILPPIRSRAGGCRRR